MNALFGRSKSRHRKAAAGGSLKARIGNPTPIDPIKINGSFIDLKISPQSGAAATPAIPPMPKQVHHDGVGDEKASVTSLSTSNSINHRNQPTRPSRADSNAKDGEFEVEDYFRSNGREVVDDADAAARFVSHGHASSIASSNPDQSQPRPYSPQQPKRNFSRPGTTSPTPDVEVASVSSSSSINSDIKGHALELSKLTIRTGVVPLTAYSPGTYQAYSPSSASYSPQPRGRSVRREDHRSPLAKVDFNQEKKLVQKSRGRTVDYFTPTQRRSSSSAYSAGITIEESERSLAGESEAQQRHRPGRLDIQPAKDLQQAETAKYFEPVSPLLPSPRRHNQSVPPLRSPEISPDIRPSTAYSTPGHLDLNLNAGELETLEISFADFTMPLPVMDSQFRGGPRISAPISPEAQKLPAYLGRLQPVQRELDYGEPPVEFIETESASKRSLSRKVSTKLRTLVGAGGRPREGFPASGAVPKSATSNPIPIPEEQREVDPDIEEMMARFDLERGPPPMRRVEKKVDDWNYNPSAASSASNLSLRPGYTSDSGTVIADSEFSSGNPGLSSHRSSTRSSNRNATPDEPVTPADDAYSFSALRGGGGTIRGDMTVKHSSTITTKFSEEVPVFLDTTNEANGGVPSFTHEPPTPEPHQTTFSRIHHDSIMPDPEHFLRGLEGNGEEEEEYLHPGNSSRIRDSTSTDSSNSSGGFIRPLPSVSTAPTSVATSPKQPPNSIAKRLPTTRKPPFGPGGPKMMLRSATMSSRQGGGAPLKPLKPAGSISENAPSILRTQTTDQPERGRDDISTPSSPYVRSGSAFSFMRGDEGMMYPDESISQVGARPSAFNDSELPQPRSPTPFDVDRSLPRQPSLRHVKSYSHMRPNTASRAQNDRVAALSRVEPDLPQRPSTGTPGRGSLLRLNTDVAPPPLGTSLSAIEGSTGGLGAASHPLIAQELQPPPVVKRSKSVGEGLRRAFSRRTPRVVTPPPVGELVPPIPSSFESGPTSHVASEVSGPLGIGTSEKSMARWNTAVRAAAVSSALRPQPDATPPSATLSGLDDRTSMTLEAQPLTAEDRRGMQHAPGTLFIRTREVIEGDVERLGQCQEHRMKPRKGGVSQRCTFCAKGPFANMWVCLDDDEVKGRCGFVVCRMCCNEKVQEGSAEIF